MWRLAGPATVLLVALSGCGGGGPADEVSDSRPVELATTAEGGTANLTVFIVNVVDRSDRIRVDVNSRSAIDATFPASAGRAHPPIFRYRFSVPVGATAVRVRTPREAKVLRFAATADSRWVVIQNQNDDPERIPLFLEVYDRRPVFG